MTAVETPAEVTWPTVAEICASIEAASILLADFAECADDAEHAHDADGVTKHGQPFPRERCRQWAADRREVVEYLAVILARCTPGNRDRDRVERLLREALDIITGSLEAATMVPFGGWGDASTFGRPGDVGPPRRRER